MKLLNKYLKKRAEKTDLLIKRANEIEVINGHLKDYLEIQKLKDILIKKKKRGKKMDLYLNKETKDNLEDIYNYSYQKYRKGLIEKLPTRSKIIRKLINGLHKNMIEEGEIKE